jgi:hypothetical protein
MANYKKVIEPVVESKEPASAAAEPVAAPVEKSVEVQKTTVCVGGYNHAAIHSCDTLEIPVAGLPKDFALADGDTGYFVGDFKKRFIVSSHSRDEKTLTIKIVPET